MSELDFLRFAYDNLTVPIKIALQKLYAGKVPKEYILAVCENCSGFLSIFSCFECSKKLCAFCSYKCSANSVMMCNAHFNKCSCGECSCELCRHYNIKNICDTCLDSSECSYTCLNCVESSSNSKTCVKCKESMDPLTQLPKKQKRKYEDI